MIRWQCETFIHCPYQLNPILIPKIDVNMQQYRCGNYDMRRYLVSFGIDARHYGRKILGALLYNRIIHHQ